MISSLYWMFDLFRPSLIGNSIRCAVNPAVGQVVLNDIKPAESRKKYWLSVVDLVAWKLQEC